MDLNEKEIKKISVLLLVLIIGILVYFLVRPLLLSIIGGLILAYAFFPVYKIILRRIKSKNASASLVSIIVVLLIIIPAYFFVPLLVSQVFKLFQTLQTLETQTFLKTIFPSAPEPFIIQITATFNSLISKISSAVLNQLVDFLLDIPKIIFNFAIVAFVFFFTLRDSDKLAEFGSGLSPLNKIQEKKIVQQFKDLTNSIVYGQILIGIVQGVTAAIGLFIFGIPNALILSAIAILLSVIPLIGPFFVWGPATAYLFLQGNTPAGVIYLIYNIVVVSNIDNLLRIYLVSRKTNLSQVIILIGMIGGLFLFGILGLILGPLLLTYFLTFLHAYRENTLSSLFKTEKEEPS